MIYTQIHFLRQYNSVTLKSQLYKDVVSDRIRLIVSSIDYLSTYTSLPLLLIIYLTQRP